MSEPGTVRFDEAWLALREAADARARVPELAERVADLLAEPHVVHDLGCGTGSMGRWLAPRLSGPQHWVLHDSDPGLLVRAAATMPTRSADGAPVTAETRHGDVTTVTAADLAGASLVTASALLDLLTREEVRRLAAACTGAGCPALFVLSVLGRVELTPADRLDGELEAAFNGHQRRVAGGRRLLGPDAVHAATEAFTESGAQVEVRRSPWRLGPESAGLAAAWLRGWVAAAVEHRPDLQVEDYLARRLAAAANGDLDVTVHHADLLAR